MKLYSSNEQYKLYEGNMLDMLSVLTPNSIDSIVTDPPYELNFMSKGWDNSGIAFQPDTWKRCFDVLKPGGYLLAFGGSRTYHRIACAIEDAGFEIRDTITWLYGSGFPKSLNIGKAIESKLTNGSANTKDWKNLDGVKVESGNLGMNKLGADLGYRERAYDEDNHLRVDKVNYKTEEGKKWDGWGSCLKPAFEPIIVARKPLDGSLTENVLKWNVGGINIDECRVGTEVVGGGTTQDFSYVGDRQKELGNGHKLTFGQVSNAPRIPCEEHEGRFPSNVILTYDETDFDEVCGGMPNTKQNGSIKNPHLKNHLGNGGIYNKYSENKPMWEAYQDSGSAARYFYCAKASKRDREEGLTDFEEKVDCDRNVDAYSADTAFNRSANARKNIHPTVKPVDLMQYLVRLVTPNGGTILDPFNGSGSTGKAVMYENKDHNKNYKYIGIEMTEEYLPISKARIEFVCNGGITLDKEEKSDIINNVKKQEEKKSTGRDYAFTWGN